jgi:hypothetical protein
VARTEAGVMPSPLSHCTYTTLSSHVLDSGVYFFKTPSVMVLRSYRIHVPALSVTVTVEQLSGPGLNVSR